MVASVYGCPSQGARVVWEYMNEKMKSELAANNRSVPLDWEWVGDFESLLIEITHQTYYIEVRHHDEPYQSTEGRNTFARFLLAAHIFDATGQPAESLFPLASVCGWDRTISITPRNPFSNAIVPSLSSAPPDDADLVQIEWYPPGAGGLAPVPGACPWHANVSWSSLSYQVYVQEITDYVGTSGVDYNLNVAMGRHEDFTYPGGDFVSLVRPPACPPIASDGTGACSSSSCRLCPRDFSKCPKEFLTNCTEVTVSILKAKALLNGTTRPVESYLKNPTRYTMWTACGLQNSSNRINPDHMTEFRPVDAAGSWAAMPPTLYPGSGSMGKWWTASDLVPNATSAPIDVSTATAPSGGRLTFRIGGLSQARNNVYLFNVVVRDAVSGLPLPLFRVEAFGLRLEV